MSNDHDRLEAALLEQLAEPFSAADIFDALSDTVFFIKNASAQYVVVNHALVQRCGVQSKADLLGKRTDEVFAAPLGDSYRAQDEEVIREGMAIRDRLELHCYPTGRFGWCITSKLPLTGKNGTTVGLVGVSKDLQTANERTEDFAGVADAVRRIRTSYDQPLSVVELAVSAGLSVYQFEQRIRRIFNVTAGHLIQKVRMEAAVARLLQSQESIASIALHCGYSDQSAFTRKFRETIGLSPLEYRRTFRSGAPVASSAALAERTG